MVKLLEWKGKKKNRESNKEHVHRKEEKDFFSYFFKGFLCLSLCWFYQQSQIGAKEKKKRPRGQWHLTLPRAFSLSLSLSFFLSFSISRVYRVMSYEDQDGLSLIRRDRLTELYPRFPLWPSRKPTEKQTKTQSFTEEKQSARNRKWQPQNQRKINITKIFCLWTTVAYIWINGYP